MFALPPTPEPNLAPERLTRLNGHLAQIRQQADQLSHVFVALFFVFGLGLHLLNLSLDKYYPHGEYTGPPWWWSLGIGGLNLLLYGVAKLFLTNDYHRRLVISLVYSIFMLQFIGEMQGMYEMHFFFFTNVALLIIYQDWRMMVPFTIVAIGHHCFFFFLSEQMGGARFVKYFLDLPLSQIDWLVLGFHFGIAIFMAIITGYFAEVFRRNTCRQFLQNLELEESRSSLQNKRQELNHINQTQCRLIEELKEAKQELTQARDEAERAAQSKEDFLSSMSHEIRTPMNSVIGMTHLLLGEEPRTDQRDRLRILRFSAENLFHLINDILDYSKIESGKLELESQPVHLETLLENIIDAHRPLAEEKNIGLYLYLSDPCDYEVLTDSTRLTQVINNLMTNAIKFTPAEGEVWLRMELRERGAGKVRLHLSVQDTGIGIPAEKQAAIFERFTQADVSTTRQFGGTGLGLSICKGLLSLMGSQIELESRVGAGSTFSFDLHLPLSEEVHRPQENPDVVWAQQDLSGMRVLVAEDNPLNVEVVTAFLRRWGVTVEVATDGQAALQILEGGRRFDLILMDLHMPVVDGFQATAEIRSWDHHPMAQVPVIAMTASVFNIEDRLVRTGLDGYIPKPFQPEQLLRCLQTYHPANRV